ncbi:nucleoporin Nup186/Nup192/Nup205 [Amylostereum chailletii]|nr:nucleoporin Nup186/Nup192/Nup205 [Amylostereum chailletii]
MAPVSHLRSLLQGVLNTGVASDEQELFDLLLVHRPSLTALFDVGPPSEAERKELQSGKVTLPTGQITVNPDFANQAIFLGQTLDCSERHVTNLMQHVISANPNLPPPDILEHVVLEYHNRRRDLVECLQSLLDTAHVASTSDCTALHAQIDLFVQRNILPGLGAKVIAEIGKMEQTIVKAQTAVQNAGSATTVQGANIRLGQNALSARVEYLLYERRSLGTNLFLIARLGHLSPLELEKIVPWLQQNPRHPMVYYMLTSLLALLDSVDPKSPGGALRQKLATAPAALSLMKTRLQPSAAWKEPGLKATVLLKWTLFLTEARHRDPSLEHKDGFKTEELETNVWNAVQGDAFNYLSGAVARLQRREGAFPTGSFAGSVLRRPADAEPSQELPADDFKPAVLQAFETLVRLVVTHASSELRKIKQRQEDHILANARPDRSRMFRSSIARPEPDKAPSPPPRNDIAIFFSLIGVLFSALPPERGLQFWGSSPSSLQRQSWMEVVETSVGKLPAFLQWAVWSTQPRDADMSIALYDMLAGLAKGQQCSELAYNFLARGTGELLPGSMMPSSGSAAYNNGAVASWNTVFGLLDSWATTNVNVRPPPQPSQSMGFMSSHQHPPPQPAPLSEKDVLLGQCFLRLLSTVATYSVAARLALTGHAHLRALPTLVALIPLPVPLELKGSIFTALAAICGPGAGSSGIEICRAVWTLLERMEVINVRGGGSLAKKGVQVELELIEETSKLYPESVPFLALLGALIHTPKQLSLRSRIADDESINTIPENLGQPYRQPGIGPFVSFVVDEVFLRIPNREYQVPRERWLMNDLCLSFIERSLAAYDLESLLAAQESQQIRLEALVPLLTHPGYELTQRLLTRSPLQSSLLGYIVDGVEGFDKNLAEEEPIFKNTIIRVLRIVHRVLEIQDVFLDVLVPLLSDLRDVPVMGTIHPRSFYSGFDQALSFASNYVPAIATYVTFTGSHPELGLLSVKILSILAGSSAFPNLTTLLERSTESERIIGGYRHILEIESFEGLDVAEEDAEQYTGAGAPDAEDIPTTLPQAVRVAVLEFFSQNTGPGSSYPNVVHFLLLGATNQQQIQDPRALGARRASIHVIMDGVSVGIPRLNRKGKDRHDQAVAHTEPLFSALPELAERFYRIVYQMCMHPRTSDFTMRYLRTREDFFVRQLSCIPFRAPASASPSIEVQYNDGARVPTTVPAFTAFLRLRSYVFDLVALDLHSLTNRGHLKAVSELLELVYGNVQQAIEEDKDWQDEVFKTFHEVGQSSMRIVEYVQSLSFDWVNGRNVEPLSLDFLGSLNLGACVRADDKGCDVVDRGALLTLLSGARKVLQAQGRIMVPADLEKLNAETAYILESCVVENQRREVSYATATGFESWRRLVDMTLIKCFSRLPRDSRETMLSDLLHEIPPIIRSGNIVDSTAVLLSEVSLSIITKLREDKHSQLLLQSAGAESGSGALSAERLHTLLRSILECILDHRVELVRGNLYAALINYFHLIAPENIEGAGSTKPGPLARSLSRSMARDDFLLGDSQASVALPSQLKRSSSSISAIEEESLVVMKPVAERLVAAICRDAVDGTEVWKTVAFMLLDCLVYLSRDDKQSTILNVLVRHGFLSNFVRDLQESDLRLQAVLKPDPDDLNALYVYEAKMSLLIRIAQSRLGADRLLDSRLLATLGQCDFLDAQPVSDQAFIDHDSFLPSAVQRYHQLFLPALQLVNAMIATLGPRHTTAVSQALEFLSSHRDTVVIMLKNETEEISLSVLDEIHLLVVLCAAVYPQAPKTELASANSGFGSIHTTLLSLAARSFGATLWSQRVQPQSDSERLDASVLAPGKLLFKCSRYAHDSKFDIAVQTKEKMLRKALIAYVGTASEFTEPDITLVLSPVMTTPRQAEQSSRLLATVPTVSDAIEALNHLSGELGETLKQIINITAELSSKHLIRAEDVQQARDAFIISLPDAELLDDLDVGQRRQLICLELERIRNRSRQNAQISLASIEMLLLLLWRHIVFYSEGQHINNPSLKTSTPGVMRHLPQSTDGQSFRAEAAKRMAPSLQRLTNVDLEYDSTATDWRANQAYIDTMSRRLRDVLGLHVEDEVEYASDGIRY